MSVALTLPDGSATAAGSASGSGTSSQTTPSINNSSPGSSTSGASNGGGKSGSKGSQNGKSGSSGWSGLIGQAVTILLGLLVIGGVAYVLYWLFTKRPEDVRARLQALGAPIPQSAESASAQNYQAVPVNLDPPKPAQPSPILLPDAAVTPLAGFDPVASQAPVSSVPGELGLTREDGTRIMLADGVNEVGREAGLGVSLVGESSVSRRHAQIEKRGSELYLTDLGSTNGTFVNGAKISTETKVQVGDVLQFGSVRVRVQE